MAKILGLTEATIRTRLPRMEESQTMRVVAMTDYRVVGFNLIASIGPPKWRPIWRCDVMAVALALVENGDRLIAYIHETIDASRVCGRCVTR